MKIDKTQIWLIIIFFWVFISFSTYFQDIVVTDLKGFKNDFLFTAVFSIGWLLWIPFTLLVVKIARQYPIHRQKLLKNFSLHFIFSIIVTALHFFSEAILMYVLIKIFFVKRNPGNYIPSYMLMTIHIQVIIYFLIVAVYQGITYVVQFQTALLKNMKLESRLVEAQNQALKMQIRPHFLFNTHNAIISLLHDNKNEEAIKMLIGLSDLLRKTLDQPGQDLVTVQDELKLVKLYLTIQELRFQERLHVCYQVDPSALKLYIPPFTLQPIIENAIIHGIEPFSDSGKLTIDISLKNNYLHIQIEDDGAGIGNGMLKSGVGIPNIKSRFENLYADDFTFTIKNHQPKGTIVNIILPAKVPLYAS